MSYIESAQWLNRAIYIVKYIVCEIYSFYLFLLLIIYIYIYIYIHIHTCNTIFVRYVDNDINVILMYYIYIYINKL